MELSLPFPRRASRRRARRRMISGTDVGDVLDRLRHHRLAWRIAVCALVSIPLLAGGWLWLRDSSLVAVRHVHITGVHGAQAIEIREALDGAATKMTTMDFNAGALRSAVSSYAIVAGVRATTHLPHTVSISVSERPPVAALLSAGQRTAVAADGTVLGPALLSKALPVVSGGVEPPVGARLPEAAALSAVEILGAAPPLLARFVVRVFEGREGLTVAMRNGLLVYFGNSSRPHAKWLSLARVLTSPSAAGALYVDVRLPERPAAGFSTTASSSTSTPVEAGSSEPTTAALAASLAQAAGSGLATSTSSSGESEASSTSTGSGASESSSSASETQTSPAGEASSGSSQAQGSSGGGETPSGSATRSGAEASPGSSSVSESGGSKPAPGG